MGDCGAVKKVFVPAKQTADVKPVTLVKGILITDVAAGKVKSFLEAEGKALAEHGLRISVVKDGCSGMSYDMALSDLKTAKDNGDKVFEKKGAFVIVEKTSYFFVTGSTLNYIEALTGSGFTIENPNTKKSCACGSSFAV